MNKEIVSSKQIISVFIMFLLGSSLVIGISPESKQDSWISTLAAIVMFAPVAIIYIRIASLFSEKNLYDIILEIFGKITGWFIVLLYTLYSIHLGALVMRNFSEFISIVSMPETPQIVILVFLLVFCAAMVKSGTETLGRWSKYILPLVVFVVIATFLFGLIDSDFSTIKPVGGTGFKNIIDGAFSAFTFPFAETVLILTLFSSVKSTDKPFRIYLIGTAISLALFLIAFLRNITLLGVQSFSMFCFPSYSAVSTISIGDFFTRFEVLMGMNFLLTGFVKISVCLFSSSIGMSKLFNVEHYKHMAYPAGLLMITLATIIYKSSIEMFAWLTTYRYYALPFQVFLPLIIWAGAEIKNFRSKRGKKLPQGS